MEEVKEKNEYESFHCISKFLKVLQATKKYIYESAMVVIKNKIYERRCSRKLFFFRLNCMRSSCFCNQSIWEFVF